MPAIFHRSLWQRFNDFLWEHPKLTLAFCASLFLLLGIGQDGINLDSATYSVIARNMAESGSWLVPHYTDYYLSQFAEHPPLVHWLQGIIFLVLPANDDTARLIGAASTLLSVLLVYAIGSLAHSRKLGILSGIVLLLTYNFMQIGNSTLLDTPMTMFSLLFIYALLRMNRELSYKQQMSVGNILLASVALAAAWLSKGIVSAPFWIAGISFVAIWKRKFLSIPRFWILPALTLLIIAVHLLIDQLFNDGYFFRRYFYAQILGRAFEEGPDIHTDWYEFSYRFVKMYLPFSLILPFGIYRVVKERLTALYPLLIALLFYILFYSIAAKLYYHYFVPVYAISSCLVALAICQLVPERIVRTSFAILVLLLISAAIFVRASGIPVHHIRNRSVYEMSECAEQYLKGEADRDIVMVSPGRPDWSVVSKTAWYWRADLISLQSMEAAVSGLNENRYDLLLLNKDRVNPDSLFNLMEPNRFEIICSEYSYVLARLKRE